MELFMARGIRVRLDYSGRRAPWGFHDLLGRCAVDYCDTDSDLLLWKAVVLFVGLRVWRARRNTRRSVSTSVGLFRKIVESRKVARVRQLWDNRGCDGPCVGQFRYGRSGSRRIIQWRCACLRFLYRFYLGGRHRGRILPFNGFESMVQIWVSNGGIPGYPPEIFFAIQDHNQWRTMYFVRKL